MPDPIFATDARQAGVALDLFAVARDLPLICPHGHVDPRLLADDEPFDDPARLLIVPDHTRSAPIGEMFAVLHQLIAKQSGAKALDVLIALGTHPAMSDEAIYRRMGMTPSDRTGKYAGTQFFNHHWDDPAQLVSIGSITEDEVVALSGGLMRESVDVTINKLALTYDTLLILGPTFPH